MHRQAIRTKYLGPTNHRSARVVAKAWAGSHTTPWDYALGVECNHARAAKALADKLQWGGQWFGGGMDNGEDCVFVCADPMMPAFEVEAAAR